MLHLSPLLHQHSQREWRIVTETTFEKEELERILLGFAIQAQKEIPDHLQKKRKRVIVLAGPTGCGKTDFSLELAEKIDGEIVSADSMQVYKGMDIGTAKATREQRMRIPHHLLNVREIHEPFNVVDFYYEARHACQEILARGNVPIVVGGAGFYLHSFLFGPPSGPPSVPELRRALENEWDEKGGEEMYDRLVLLDPAYAKTITKHDRQKVIRALEIIRLTARKVSELSWTERRRPQNYDFRCWFLYRPRESLYKRIDARCDKMLAEGFVEEVKRLKEKGLEQNHSAAMAIGYRHVLRFLQTSQTPEDYEAFVHDFKQASRQYAKKQMTWFRNTKEAIFHWLDLDLHDREVAMEMIINDFESR